MSIASNKVTSGIHHQVAAPGREEIVETQEALGARIAPYADAICRAAMKKAGVDSRDADYVMMGRIEPRPNGGFKVSVRVVGQTSAAFENASASGMYHFPKHTDRIIDVSISADGKVKHVS